MNPAEGAQIGERPRLSGIAERGGDAIVDGFPCRIRTSLDRQSETKRKPKPADLPCLSGPRSDPGKVLSCGSGNQRDSLLRELTYPCGGRPAALLTA